MLCQCGCGGETSRARRTENGKKKGEPYDYLPNHHLALLHERLRRPPGERFMKKTRLDDSGCILWTGTILKTGYGNFRGPDGKTMTAHRFAYLMVHGAIPPKWHVDHLCRNRACVNPAHLEAVPHRTNILRGAGLTVALHNAGVCKRGHPQNAENTYYRKDGRSGKAQCRVCKRLVRRQKKELLG